MYKNALMRVKLKHEGNDHSMKAKSGFTLIEILIVIAMISILTAIAIPNYRDYVTRGKIPDATSNLAGKRVQMEQFFQDNRTYVGGTGCTSDTTTSQNFDFSCSVGPTTSTYTIQAAGKSVMAGFTFTVDQNNAKGSQVTAAWVSKGWASNAACWITNKGGIC